MKYLLPVLFFVILTMSFNIKSVNSAPLNGALEDINRITSEINEYNKKYEGYFKDIILKNFSHQITKTELDSLIIVPDPMFIVRDQCRVRPELVDENYNKEIMRNDTKDYYILNMYGNGNIYNCIIEPYPFSFSENTDDTIRTILRLYTPLKKHKYNIILVQPPLIYWSDFKGGSDKDNNNIEDIDSKYAKYDNIPMDYICFCLDIQLLDLAKCVIINDKIYSIGCMRNKYPKLPYSEIFKLSPEELESCDINNCFTPPK